MAIYALLVCKILTPKSSCVNLLTKFMPVESIFERQFVLLFLWIEAIHTRTALPELV